MPAKKKKASKKSGGDHTPHLREKKKIERPVLGEPLPMFTAEGKPMPRHGRFEEKTGMAHFFGICEKMTAVAHVEVDEMGAKRIVMGKAPEDAPVADFADGGSLDDLPADGNKEVN
jgi:hypothetical protein